MDLKELKRLADTLDDNGKRELFYLLQSRQGFGGSSSSATTLEKVECINSRLV